MDKEIEALWANDTWTKVKYVAGTRFLGSHWVYDVKFNEVGNVYKFKARLVARGDRQVAGLDYGETFAATAQMRTVRILITLALIFGGTVTHCDISNAFTNGELKEELYMSALPGYPNDSGIMLRVVKSLYGLCQASRVWQETLTAALLSIGFVQCKSDTCLFFHPDRLCFISIHVDDLLILCDNDDFRKSVVMRLQAIFKLEDLGVVKMYLGMNINFPTKCPLPPSLSLPI
jgi:hypothetical protein